MVIRLLKLVYRPMKSLVILQNQPLKESVSGSTLRLKSDGYSDDGAAMGVTWTTRSEHLTAVVHRQAGGDGGSRVRME